MSSTVTLEKPSSVTSQDILSGTFVTGRETSSDCILILSGGLDSTTLAYYLVKHMNKRPEALSFYYGQRHSREIDSAVEVARLLGLPHRVVDLNSIAPLIRKGALTGGEDVPAEHYSHESQKITVVPNRNSIMLSIAVGRAVTLEAHHVYYAAHHGDRAQYPDCREEFIEAFQKAVVLATDGWVEVHAPFVKMTKTDIVRWGLQLGVPFEETWSCYLGKVRPCKSCGTCLERSEAFLNNGVKDPLLTDDEWLDAVKYLEAVTQKPAVEVKV